MNDLDELATRLHDLGRQAPVPTVDPILDVRRGRVALRRRRTRGAAGVTSAVVAIGLVGPALHWSGGTSSDGSFTPGQSPSTGVASQTPTPSDAPQGRCDLLLPSMGTEVPGEGADVAPRSSGGVLAGEPPEVRQALSDYREAAATILDPDGDHLDRGPADNIQSGSSCDPETGEELATHLGTKIGWTDGDALGVVRVEVVAAGSEEPPQVVFEHQGWAPFDGGLPAGVTSAKVVTFADSGGGTAVVAEREDGLTVAVDTAGIWGNNAAPGSPPTTSRPTTGSLLKLAASPQLTLPAP